MQCRSVLKLYAKKKRGKALAVTLTMHQTAPRYQGTAASYFLTLLSFLPMKENSKKDHYTTRVQEKASGGGGGGVAERDRLYCLWEVNDGTA